MGDNYYDPVRWFQHTKSTRPGAQQGSIPFRPPEQEGPIPPVTGMAQPGNINMNNRPRVVNPDGSVSSIKSASFNLDGREVLLPTISDDGRNMSEDETINQYLQSGRHLGTFPNVEEADAQAQRLHNDQATLMSAPPAPPPSPSPKTSGRRPPKRRRRAIP